MASKKNTPKPFIFDDESKGWERDKWFCPMVDGEVKGHGLVSRDYSIHPPEMFDPPSQLKLFARSEWSARAKEGDRRKSTAKDVRAVGMNGQPIPSLDQNGKGYCWAHSTTSNVMLLRAMDNQPYVRLSAYAIACKIKGFRDEGGWCGLSAKFWKEQGCPSDQFWPERSMARTNDNAQTWANALTHKVTEDWIDLTRNVYDQNLTFDQLATLLLVGLPCAVDFNWWSHSVCAVRLVEVEAGSFGIEIWNSWGDSWGEQGMGILRGSKAIPDGAVCLRVTGATKD